jgi:ubiquitin carboxyl-terminal hydrolase 4/11/15
MVGQYKSTVVCSTCSKISVCFDPFLVTSLSIPSSQDWKFYLITPDLNQGAIEIEFEFQTSTNFNMLENELK